MTTDQSVNSLSSSVYSTSESISTDPEDHQETTNLLSAARSGSDIYLHNKIIQFQSKTIG